MPESQNTRARARLGTRRETRRQTRKSRDCRHTNATTNATCEARKPARRPARRKCNRLEERSCCLSRWRTSSGWYVLAMIQTCVWKTDARARHAPRVGNRIIMLNPIHEQFCSVMQWQENCLGPYSRRQQVTMYRRLRTGRDSRPFILVCYLLLVLRVFWCSG